MVKDVCTNCKTRGKTTHPTLVFYPDGTILCLECRRKKGKAQNIDWRKGKLTEDKNQEIINRLNQGYN